MFGSMDKLLNCLYEHGLANCGENWLDEIRGSLTILRDSYAKLARAPGLQIDYSQPSTQVAYVYGYAVGRCAFTTELLRRYACEMNGPLFRGSPLKVVSLGGGPGSELAGLIEYLSDPSIGERVSEIKYTVFDKCDNWRTVIENFVQILDCSIKVSVNFVNCDFTSEQDIEKNSLNKFDLVICSYLMSELSAHSEPMRISENLRNLFSTMKPGANIFYNDTSAYASYNFFNESRKRVQGLREITEIKDVAINCSHLQLGPTYNLLSQKLEHNPRLGGSVLSKFLVRDST